MQSASFTGVLLKTYKELLRKLKSQHGLDEPQHSTAQVAALQAVTRRKLSTQLSPKRAFARLKQYLLDLQPVHDNLPQPASSGRAALNSKLIETQPQTSAVPDPQLNHLFGQNGVMRAGLMFLVATLSKQLMHNTSVVGREHLEAALQRAAGKPLITVSNHVSALDDPLVIATMLPEQYHQQPESLRWTLCATDRCFTNPLFSAFFRTVKVLPVERGAGLNQLGMQAAEARLASGDWVHIFPEGTRSRDGKLGAARKGVGRLIATCPQPPLIVPFVHRGMSDVLPRGSIMPRSGQQVDVVVGEPIVVDDVLARASREAWSEDQLYQALAQRVGARLKALHAQLHGEAGLEAEQAAAVSQAACGEWGLNVHLPAAWQQHWPLRDSVAVDGTRGGSGTDLPSMHAAGALPWQGASGIESLMQAAGAGARLTGASARQEGSGGDVSPRALGRVLGGMTALGGYMRERARVAASMVNA